MKSVMDTITLNNGVQMPCVGFGTFLTPDGRQAVDAVAEALRVGYRLIDTASYYENERSVGQAVRNSGIDRSQVFVTSKVWNSDQGYENTLRAFDRTMNNLGLDYLDLYLIHWPRVKGHEDEWPRLNRETWQAMEQLYQDGRIKAIGVSNFKPHHIDSLMEMATILPQVDQIELHPGLNQAETVDYCRANNIVVEAWSPFSRGKLFASDALDAIGAKYGKTPAQVSLRWMVQQGIVPLPKSVTPARIRENSDIFDFSLNEEEMEYISGLKVGKPSNMDPDKVAW